MRFEVDHTTRYEYSRAVFLEPHAFRLRPRCDSFQRLVRHSLHVDPQPMMLSENLDAEGNAVAQAWFSDMTQSLELRVSFEVETLRANPFDYLLLQTGPGELPLQYPPEQQRLLSGYLDSREKAAGPVEEFARSIADRVNGQLLPFLNHLNQQLFDQTETVIRDVGAPLHPEQTLQDGVGACRDLTVLFMACCRAMGIAARFVSGYRHSGEAADRRHMHAWAEVFIPGGGWRGFDPTDGLAVADHHIAVAASAHPESAAPTSGTFRGNQVTSNMRTELKIRALSWFPPENPMG